MSDSVRWRALAVLIELLENPDVPVEDRIAAAELILGDEQQRDDAAVEERAEKLEAGIEALRVKLEDR